MQSRAVELDNARQAQVVPQEQGQAALIPLLNGGIRTDRAPIDLDPNQCVEQEALHMVAGRLVVDTGYSDFGDALVGTPQKTFQAVLDDGTAPLLCFTTSTLYVWNVDQQQWQLPAWVQINQLTAPLVAGNTVAAVDDVTGMAVDQLIGIMLDSGQQHIATITNIAVLNVTFTPAIPAGEAAAAGNDAVGSAPLGGLPASSQVSAAIFPPNNWIIFCNGVTDVMYYYAGVVDILGGLPADTTCRAISVFHECLLLGGTTEGGTPHPHRVRMSDQADPEQWTVGVGIAAIYDLLDTDDPIFALLPLGPWLICYRDQSIMRASYVGALNETLFWEYMVTSDGIQSQGAVVVVANEHYLVGHVNVWKYTGGYVLEPVGDAIYNSFLAAAGDLNAPARLTLFMVYVQPLREVWIIYPRDMSEPSLVPDRMLRYSLATGGWQTRTFADSFYGAGTYIPVDDGVAWEDAQGIWTDALWARPWDSRIFQKNVASIMLACAERPQIVVYDYAAPDDSGTTIPWHLVTRQFGDEAQFTRWEELRMLAQGDSILVEWSEDEGETWTVAQTVSLGSGPPVFDHIDIDRVSTRLQLRFSGTDRNFELRRGRVENIADSEW